MYREGPLPARISGAAEGRHSPREVHRPTEHELKVTLILEGAAEDPASQGT